MRIQLEARARTKSERKIEVSSLLIGLNARVLEILIACSRAADIAERR